MVSRMVIREERITVMPTIHFIRRVCEKWVFTPILTFPRQGGRDWIPAFAGMTVKARK